MGAAAKGLEVDLTFPEKFTPMFQPSRYKVARGGRGGAKSFTFARLLLAKGVKQKIRVLCTRELQNSISESVHLILSDQIEAMGLGAFYKVTRDSIKGINGTMFIFMGVKNNITKVKSTEGVDICWVEEAEKVSDNSWDVLIPTIRKEGSEIWISFNPSDKDDPTYQRFVVNPPPNCIEIEINYYDNPWFPDTLREEMETCRERNPDKYNHIWLGKTRKTTDAQIFANTYRVDSFEPSPHWDGPYYGVDWGFSVDPTVMVKCWIGEQRLWIEKEAWAKGCELDDLHELFDGIEGSRNHTSFADNARPETISYVQRDKHDHKGKQEGFPLMESVEKWPGSIEDGIDYIKSAFIETVIHPSCTHTIDDWFYYSFKIDRLTEKITRDIVDADNHSCDAVRYALSPMIKYMKAPTIKRKTVAGLY